MKNLSIRLVIVANHECFLGGSIRRSTSPGPKPDSHLVGSGVVTGEPPFVALLTCKSRHYRLVPGSAFGRVKKRPAWLAFHAFDVGVCLAPSGSLMLVLGLPGLSTCTQRSPSPDASRLPLMRGSMCTSEFRWVPGHRNILLAPFAVEWESRWLAGSSAVLAMRGFVPSHEVRSLIPSGWRDSLSCID
jgi:hypothetical protein